MCSQILNKSDVTNNYCALNLSHSPLFYQSEIPHSILMITQALQNLYKNAYLLLALTALFWAGNFVMGRGVNEIVPPIALSFWRWLFAALIMLSFSQRHIRTDWPVIKKNIPKLLLLGFLSGACFNALTYVGLHYTTATNALVLNATIAITIVIANFLMFAIKLDRVQSLALIISLIGVLVIISAGDISNLLALRFNSGDLLIFIAVVGWAIYTALLPTRPKMHWMSFTSAIFVSAALMLAPAALIEYLYFTKLEINLPSFAAIGYATIFPGLLAYIFYNRGVELVGGNKAGIAIYLMPLFGTLLSILFLGEIPELFHLIGFAMIIGGVVMSSLANSN